MDTLIHITLNSGDERISPRSEGRDDYHRAAQARGGRRRLYELARKHCGNQEQWTISLELLHKKAGSTAPVWKFRQVLIRVIRSNELPDYRIDYQQETNQVVFVRR